MKKKLILIGLSLLLAVPTQLDAKKLTSVMEVRIVEWRAQYFHK